MKKALVLLNMGGPNSLDEVEVFLKNMFNDKNIISIKSDLLRSFIAFMIVTLRKNAAKENYKKIGGKSPIVGYTKQLVQKLQDTFEDTYVTFAMRYTSPSAQVCIQELKEKGIQEIILLPLFPHFSTTTTKSSLEDFRKALREANFDVKKSSIKRFYKNELYNELIAEQIIEALEDKNSLDFDLIFSAHSLPQRIVDKGDPYQREILAHVELVKRTLEKKNVRFKDIHVAYQSKLGPVKWLEPSLEDKLKSLDNKKVIISPLSFTVDNSETEFELWIEYKEVAEKLGFKEYLVARCPNDSAKFVETIEQIAKI
jgi:ferrochelatase